MSTLRKRLDIVEERIEFKQQVDITRTSREQSPSVSSLGIEG